MTRKVLTIAHLALLTTTMLAGEGGSAYSIFGIGDIRYFPNSRSAGMGYTAIGIPTANYINSISPATWSRINRVRLEGSFLFEGYSASDGVNSSYRADGDFNGALLAIPISSEHGIVFAGGFVPYSSTNYLHSTTGTRQGVDFTLEQKGTGGLNRALAGLSYSPATDLSLGASLDVLFGSIERSTTLRPASSALAGGTTNERLTTRGATATFGALYTGFGSWSEPLKPLALGVTVSAGSGLGTERQFTYQFLDDLDTSDLTKGTMTVPFSYGIGIAYQAGERYLIAADYYAQQWRDTKINGIHPVEIRNSFRLGLGGEHSPSRDGSASWLERITYRLGFSYHSTYYEVLGQPINEWLITSGLAIPLSGETRLNVALEYGGRGLNTNGLIKDRIIRLALSLNIGELWFVRYEEE